MSSEALNNITTFDESDYYNYSRILSYNKMYNFVIGARGIGKTFGAKRLVINKFLKEGKQFIYLRRYQTEHESIKTFFDDIKQYFDGHTFEVKHKAFYIDGNIAGWYLALNTSGGKKSVTYNNVSTIIFDEFIIEQSARGYLKSEVDIFIGMYETVARGRYVKVLFLSNSVSQVNPYFVFWNIHLSYYQRIWRSKQIVVERCDSKQFSKKKKLTPFGQLIEGTRLSSYMIDNNWLDDSDVFIEPMSGNCKPICIISYMSKNYYVWVRESDSIIYFTNKSKIPDGTVKLALTTSDHNINYKFVRSPNSSRLLSTLMEAYTDGSVRFNNLVSKQAFIEVMQLI